MLFWITSGKEIGGSVLKSNYKFYGFIAVLAWSGMVSATGLGGINVSSSLGQPLKAEIELVSVDKADSSSISAKLASPEAFKSAGVDYPYSLPKLKFEIINRDSGNPSIKLTSSQPVNDPFITLMVEVTWSSGKLLREYTFLLDPVDFLVQEPHQAPVSTIAPVVVAPAQLSPPAEPVASEPTPDLNQPEVTAPVENQQVQVSPDPTNTVQQSPTEPEVMAATEPAAVEQTTPVPVEASIAPAPVFDALSKEEAIPVAEPVTKPLSVVRGDTLSKIALKSKPADVSLERMLVALYRANTNAFAGKNMNRLKTGKIIRLPDASELEVVKQDEAVKEVRAQVADWNVYRQQLAAVKTEAPRDTAKQVSSGKINTAVAESTSSKVPSKEILKLSKGEAPGDKVAGGGKTSVQEKANAKEEESIAKSKALKDAQDRTALLEKNVKDLQRLAELKNQSATATTSASAASAVAPVVSASAPVAVKPKIVVPAPKVVEEASLLEDPIILASGVAGLIALGGVGFFFMRRNKKSVGKKKSSKDKLVATDIGGATGRIAAPVIPSPDTGDFTQSATPESTTQIHSDEVDPIGEADLFLTFGRDVQAEEVLTEALKSNPNNSPVRLKLLSIYATRKDINSFFTHAKFIKESGDEAAWSKAAAMGLALEPSNPLYGGDGVAVASASQPSVDFDLGFGSSQISAQAAPDLQVTAVLEKPSNESTTILSSSELRAAQGMPTGFEVKGTGIPATQAEVVSPSMNLGEMDFDVTSTHSGISAHGGTAKSLDVLSENMDDLIFDVTASHAKSTESEKPTVAPKDEGGLAFTLDFPTDFKAPEPVDIGLGDISLNLGGLASAEASSGSKDDRWQEVATKLDLAKAYQEMGDAAGAKEILDEVLRDGDAEQRANAEAMMQQL
jgi:pilus assembly protein FimV